MLVSRPTHSSIYVSRNAALNQDNINEKLSADFGLSVYNARNEAFKNSIANPSVYLDGKGRALAKVIDEEATPTFKRHYQKFLDQGLPASEAEVLAEQAAYRVWKNGQQLVNMEFPDYLGDMSFKAATGGSVGLNDYYARSNLGDIRARRKQAKRKIKGKKSKQ